MTDESYLEVCMAASSFGAAGENTTRTSLGILSVFTTVSIVTVDLSDDSAIRY